jgi:hypothetical protein
MTKCLLFKYKFFFQYIPLWFYKFLNVPPVVWISIRNGTLNHPLAKVGMVATPLAKMGVVATSIIFLFFFYIYIYIRKKSLKKNCSHVSTEVCHEDRCRACMPTPVGWHGWTLFFYRKMDRGTISVFFHITGTTYDKK